MGKWLVRNFFWDLDVSETNEERLVLSVPVGGVTEADGPTAHQLWSEIYKISNQFQVGRGANGGKPGLGQWEVTCFLEAPSDGGNCFIW